MIATNLLALALMAALNPLVARAPEPRGFIPADCAVSNAAPMPRITAAVVDDSSAEDAAAPLPPVRPVTRATNVASPAATSDIADLKRALVANDRPAFDAALARAKAAGVSTRVYEDVARLWDAQFQSPFFVEDSDAYRVASGYPGYAEAVRRQVFTDAHGRKFYPAAESRAFVATHAGMRSPAARPATSTRETSPSSPVTPRVTPRVTTGSPAPTTSSARRASGRTSSTPVTRKPAASRTRARSSSPDPSAPPKIAAREPAPVASPVGNTSSTEAPPAAGTSQGSEPAPSFDTMANQSVVTETSAGDSGATDTMAAGATATDTTATAVASDTATTAADTSPSVAVPATKGRSILIPAILILIGLGVLILLFRTQS